MNAGRVRAVIVPVARNFPTMKLFLPALCCLLVVNLAARSTAQESSPANRPPGSAQRSAEATSPNSALGDVLGELGRLLGKTVLTDATVSVTASLTLPDLNGVDPQRKARLIEQTLFLNNYTLIDADKDTVIVLGPGKNPRSVGLPLYMKPEELPSGERVFSYLFKLEHLDPIEVAGVLQQLIPPGNEVNFTAVEKSHLVIATGRTSVLRTVIRLVAAFDAADPK